MRFTARRPLRRPRYLGFSGATENRLPQVLVLCKRILWTTLPSPYLPQFCPNISRGTKEYTEECRCILMVIEQLDGRQKTCMVR
jgi:hypothetical protein